MANNCQNTLTVSGPPDHLQAFRDLARGKAPGQALSLESLRRTPPGLQAAERGDWVFENRGPSGEPRSVRLAESRPDTLEYGFITAWSPPNREFMAHLSRQFPLLAFRIEYEEPMAGYEGSITAARGEITDADHRRFHFEERYTAESQPHA